MVVGMFKFRMWYTNMLLINLHIVFCTVTMFCLANYLSYTYVTKIILLFKVEIQCHYFRSGGTIDVGISVLMYDFTAL